MTLEEWNKAVDWAFRKVPEPDIQGPRVDVQLLVKHGIPFHFATPEMVFMSDSGMRRARELGLVVDPKKIAETNPYSQLFA